MTETFSTVELTEIEHIRNLKARYARHADAKEWGRMAALFTVDGVMRFYDVEGTLSNEVHAGDIENTFTQRVGGGTPIHHLFSHEIEITSDTTATGLWAMEDLIFHDLQRDPGAAFETMHGFGHYHEAYRKVDGTWRLAVLELTRTRLEFTH